MEAKQKYVAPALVEYGRVEDLTQGWWGPNLDFFTGKTPGLFGGPAPDQPPVGHTSS